MVSACVRVAEVRGSVRDSCMRLLCSAVGAQVFAAALRLLLGRLRTVERLTGKEILRCLDWEQLQRSTDYIPRLWSGGEEALL